MVPTALTGGWENPFLKAKLPNPQPCHGATVLQPAPGYCGTGCAAAAGHKVDDALHVHLDPSLLYCQGIVLGMVLNAHLLAFGHMNLQD